MIFHVIFGMYYFGMVFLRLHFHRGARKVRTEVVHRESRLNMAIRGLLGLGYMGALTLYIFYPPLLDWGVFRLPLWVNWLGVGVTGLSIASLWWVHSALGVQFDTTLHTQSDHQLISHGPYRWVRHPMYTSLFLMGVGWLLLTANWLVGVPLMVSITVIAAVRVPQEEKVMMVLFGDDYIAYMRDTGRYLPTLRH